MEPVMPIKAVDSSMTLIHHFVERSAHLFPDKTALVHGNLRATYDEINSRANNLAGYLKEKGVQKGDRIALLMENCLEYVVSYYGILKAQAVAVPLNSDLKIEGLRYAVEDLEAKAMISSSRFEKVLQASELWDLGLQDLVLKAPKARWDTKISVADLNDVALPKAAANPSLDMTDSDLGSIIYTSGSTGGPKGVMLTHQNIVHNTFSICQYLRLTEEDTQMCVLPFFYVMGKSLLNTHFAVGGTVVINNQFAFPATVVREMISEEVTGFSGVPSTFAYLLHRSPLAASRDKLTSLRYCSQAGGHMSRAVKEQLRRVLPPHTQVVVMYGATEGAARLSYLDPHHFADKMESIGKAIPGVMLMVMNEKGEEAAIGEVGELVASGSNIMPGYWKKPEATSKALVDGWYHTGDRAYKDDAGFFFVVGRQDDLLKVGGHRLSPQEIEDTLMESGMFVEVVVLGIPDNLLGNRLVTLGVPANADCSEMDILSYCAAKLPKFKVPSEVKFAKTLPKKTSGKIDRKGCLVLFRQS